MKSDIQLLQDVQPLQNVQPLLDIQPLQDIEVLQDVTPLGHATNYNTRQRQRRKQTDVADSLLDVLLGKDQRDALFEEVNMPSWIKDIPVLNVQAAVPALLYRNYMQPIVDAINGKKSVGQVGIEIGLNTLNELSEDLDVLSNIVKSQAPDAGGKFLSLKTLGDSLGANGTRVKYNYNTGNTLADIGLEIVSDPLTWLTLGASAAEVAGTKGLETAVTSTIKTTTEALSDTALKTLNKAIVKEVIEEGTEATVKNVLKRITDKTIRKEILAAFGNNYNTLRQVVERVFSDLVADSGYKIAINATKIKSAAKTFNEGVNSVAKAMTPIALYEYTGLKDALPKAVKILTANIKEKLYDDFELARLFAHGSKQSTNAIDLNVYLKNKSMFSKLYKQNIAFFEKNNIDVVTFQRKLKDFLIKKNIDVDEFLAEGAFLFNGAQYDRDFKKYLQQQAPLIKSILDDPHMDDYFKQDAINYIAQNYVDPKVKLMYDFYQDAGIHYHPYGDEMRELLTAGSAGALSLNKVEQQFKNEYSKATIKSMKTYAEKHANDLDSLYKYIDDVILDYKGVHYGLDELDSYLAAIISDLSLDHKRKMDIINILETAGVNIENAASIKQILNSDVKNKSLEIKKILESTSDISLLKDKDYEKITDKMDIRIKNKSGNVINKAFKAIPEMSKSKYSAIMSDSFKNIKQAATFLQNAIDTNPELVSAQTDTRIVHATKYMQNTLRLQDISNIQKTISEIDLNVKHIDALMESLTPGVHDDVDNAILFYEDAKTTLWHLKDFFEKTDKVFKNIYTDTSTAFELVDWYQDLLSTEKELKQSIVDLISTGQQYGVQLRTRFKQIAETIEYLKKPKIKDNITNYIDNVEGLLWAQLSHLGMFDELVQHTHLSENPRTKLFLEQVANPESVYRKRYIPILDDAFQKAGMFAQSENLRKVVAQIDTTMNLSKLLTTEIPYDLDTKTSNTLLNIVFDTIVNNSNFTISDILAQDAMNIGDLKPLKYSESVLSGIEEDVHIRIRERLYKDIDRTIDHPGSTAIREMLAKNNISTDEIKKYLHSLLDTYISNQSKIDYIDNVALASLYSIDTTEMLKLTDELKYTLAGSLLAYADNMPEGLMHKTTHYLTGTPVDLDLYNAFDALKVGLNNFYKDIKLGTKEIENINKKLYGPLSAYAASGLIRDISEQSNLLTASLESGIYSTKRVIPRYNDTNFIKDFNLAPEGLKGNTDEYMLLADRLVAARDIIHEPYKYEDKYINELREVLIQVYERTDALFAPVDPKTYFNSLDAQHLLTWEVVTKGNLSNNNKTAFYTLETKYKHMCNIDKYSKANFISSLEAATRNVGFVNSDELAYQAAISRKVGAAEYTDRVVKANLLSTWHDLNDLTRDKDKVSLFIKNDVKDYDYITKTIHNIEDNPTRNAIQSFGPYHNEEDVALVLGNSYGYEEGLFEDQREEKISRNIALATEITNMDAEELATYIYNNTDGALVFYNNNIVRTLNADKSITWSGLPNIFNFTKEELKEAGLKIQQDSDWYYIRLTDNRVHNKVHTFAKRKNINNMAEKYNNLIDKYYYKLNAPSNDVPSDLIVVETLNKDTWNKFMAEHLDFFGDVEEQKLYQKLTPQGNSSFFNKSFERLNLAVVGGYDAYNLWNQTYSDTFIPHSQQMSRNTLSGLTSIVARTNKINKYLSLFFNSDFRLDSPLMNKMFKDATDDRIKEFFKKDNYRVAILKADKQGLPIVFEKPIYNRKDLGKAIAEGGILVPKETYYAMKQIVNNRMMSDSLADIFRRVVPSTYKSMYLFTPGFLLRNAFDTLLYKNMNELGGLEALPEVLKYENAASKAIQLHNKIQQEVLDETNGETFNKETLLQVLARHTKNEQDTYFLVDVFTTSSASGTLSESLSNFLEEYNKLGVDDIRPLWEKFYEDKILFGKQPLNPLAWTRNLNTHIEQTGRLGLFLASVDSGMPINKAIERVVKTHFDYNSMPDMMDICERIFWFSTFPLNNFNYYINGGLTKSPLMLNALMDVQTASWNNGEYTYEELKKTKFLSYHALAGNVRIGNWIVKLSPSVFDFISLVTDPVGNIKDRLNPFLSMVVNPKETEPLDLNPFQTQIRNWKKFKEGNPLPSVLSKIETQKWSKPLRKYYRRKNYSSSWTSYPKIRKPKYNKLYVYKSRVHRIDASVRKNHRNYVRKTAVFHQRIPRYTGRVSYIQWKY